MLLKMWQLVCLAYILKLARAENIEIAMSEDENVYMETNVCAYGIDITVECKANELIKSCEWKWRNISSNSPHAEKWKNTDYSVGKASLINLHISTPLPFVRQSWKTQFYLEPIFLSTHFEKYGLKKKPVFVNEG